LAGLQLGKKHVRRFGKTSFGISVSQKDALTNIFLAQSSRCGTQEVIQLLDGQQRLATATIWFCVIQDIAKSNTQETSINTGQ
jgi:hypothetical protein